MQRRGFLNAMAALPFVASLLRQPPPKLSKSWYQPDADGNNSGTFHFKDGTSHWINWRSPGPGEQLSE